MGLLDLIAWPLTAPLKGITWIAEKVAQQAEKELYSEDAVRGKLLELELAFDLGEINEQDYEVAERNLLERLKVIRERQAQMAAEARGDG
jgi:hypothetical protein